MLLRLYVQVKAAETTQTAEAGVIVSLPDSARVYALRPGLGPPVGTNGHGFRGEPVDVEKPVGVHRIVMLGDSITFGNAVEWNETFSFILQQMLNERAGSRKFEVLNLGVSGYNTRQELATLSELGLRYSPDLIVLNVCLNDSDPVKTVSPIGLINEAGVREFSDINVRTVIEASYLLTALKYALIAMVIYPYSSQVGLSPDRLGPQQDLLALAEASAVPTLEASPAYENQVENMFADGIIHLAPHGHRVIAVTMRDFLTEHGLLPAD